MLCFLDMEVMNDGFNFTRLISGLMSKVKPTRTQIRFFCTFRCCLYVCDSVRKLGFYFLVGFFFLFSFSYEII